MKKSNMIKMIFCILAIFVFNAPNNAVRAENEPHVNQLHHSLDKFSVEEKANSLITLDLPSEDNFDDNPIVKRFETEWNSGQYVKALQTIDELGQTYDVSHIGFEIEWKTPIETERSPNSYECVRVGNRDSIYVTEYDIDRSSGNLLAVLALKGDGAGTIVTTNFSDDNGATWVETYYYQSANVIMDVDCAVYDGYCIVAFIAEYNYILARRFSMATGLRVGFPSGESGIQVAYNHIFWDEISLISIQDIDNHAAYDVKFYLAANRTTRELYLFRADANAELWTAYTGGVSDVTNGLDICLNEINGNMSTSFHLFGSYLTSTEDLKVIGWHSSVGFGNLYISGESASDALFTSIDAYENKIYCVFEAYLPLYTVRSARMCRTNDGGGMWYDYDLEDNTYSRYAPDITARSGGGLGIVYRKNGLMGMYNGRIQWGDYDFVPYNGPFTCYNSPVYNVRPCLELLNSGYYGVLHVKQPLMVTPQAYFCTEGYCCDTPGDANSDFACNVGDAVYLINYVFKSGPAPACRPAGDANNDCAINVGDAVYLINYVFKSGPPPVCGCVG